MSLRSPVLRSSLFLTAAAVACVAGPAWAQTKTFNVPAHQDLPQLRGGGA